MDLSFLQDQSAASKVGEKRQYGPLYHQHTMAVVISCIRYLIYGGGFSTISSATTSLVGALRVLQALENDKLHPKIEFFALGWGVNNDPVFF